MKLRRHRHAELPAETSERMIPTDIIAFAAESIMYPQKPGEIPAARQPCAAPDTASTSPTHKYTMTTLEELGLLKMDFLDPLF